MVRCEAQEESKAEIIVARNNFHGRTITIVSFSTFGGNPLACAVARAALRVLVEEKLIENAEAMGKRFMDGLRAIDNAKIKDVRGRGLLIGVEYHEDAGGARQYCEKLKEAGLLCKETHDNIIRFAPPLVITEQQVDWALERINPILST